MDFESSVQNISWFVGRHRDGGLTLKPPYQRKPVWSAKQKCYLIESILMGLPVPEIYIQQETSAQGETRYAIVDGQQRIRTVLQFVGLEKEASEEDSNSFELDKLPPTSPWYGKTFASLSEDAKKKFYGYRFAVRYLNTGSDEDVRDMFRRLNSFLSPLKPQELRNATYSGPFAQLMNSLADDEYWAENRIVTAASIRRMGDIEFVSELMIGVLHGPQGGSATIIDEYYKNYEDYDDAFPDQRTAHKIFNEALACVKSVLPDIKETRWSNKSDFYTLFVGVASLLRTHELPANKVSAVEKALCKLADEVGLRLSNETASVSEVAVAYVRAVEKGANDKKRRADRQEALLSVISKYFTLKKKP